MPNTKTMGKLSAAYLADEADIVAAMPQAIGLTQQQRLAISASAAQLVKDIRSSKTSRSAIDDLLQEYGLSSAEGVVLMRLAESLIRTPDFATARRLIRDKIETANWAAHRGKSASFLVNQATTGLRVTAAWVAATGGVDARNLSAKLGDRVMARAVDKAVAIMGDHFVLGQTIAQARHRARANEAKGATHSYDMLGEAAYTHADAAAYFAAYMEAVQDLAANADGDKDMARAAGLSIKLSALHPRYEYAQRDTCVPILVERITALARIAKQAGLWLTIDAEEADRTEISLLVFEKLLREPSLADWAGLGLVVQAYQRRALPLIDYLVSLAKSTQRKIAVRLVKGAYWDMEIKRAQELGLASYPVFTRKENTDVSYLACARKLLAARGVIFPQFATHNAHSAAAVAAMAASMNMGGEGQSDYEFQRLHGMGAALHAQLMDRFGVASRIYAPVGKHRDLLAYLVRRLLENGANNSFVNQVLDEAVAIDDIVSCPLAAVATNQSCANPRIVPPADIVEAGRVSAFGIDLTQADVVAKTTHAMTKSAGVVYHAASRINGQAMAGESNDIFSPQDTTQKIGTADYALPAPAQVGAQIDEAVRWAQQSDWSKTNNPQERAAIFAKAADLLEQEMTDFLNLLVQEAGKTLPDALSELREAVDFCRYYGQQAQRCHSAARAPLGIIACISPWNFPLAIFLGQIVAALSVGNKVIAKPAEQTPLIAAKAVDLLYRAGLPPSALGLLIGDGAQLGNALTRNRAIAGVCFTGSTRTAKLIAANLADTGRGDIPFIAETGGLNAMLVDSTALLEQAVKDVLESSFQSAGQRCSACRIVCVQEDIYADFVKMLTGAMDTLIIGNPSKLETDVGPLIDAAAQNMVNDYKKQIATRHKVLKSCALPDGLATKGHFVAPTLVALTDISDISREIFGPILHIVKFKSGAFDTLIEKINALGYGLTLGLHTRLDSRMERVANLAHIGNIYVNRNQIGAVVGVNPFGGEGLSGTGPKAGGPHYLFGLTQTAAQKRDTPAATSPIKNVAPASAKLQKIVQQAAQAAQKYNAQFTPPEQMRIAEKMATKLLSPDDKMRLAFTPLTQLPGATGEENTLRLAPRGVFVCFGGDDEQSLAQQFAKVLAAGSAAIIAASFETKLRATLASDIKALPESLVQRVSFADGLALINAPIDGLVADGGQRADIAAHACHRDGAILPVLAAADPIERFLHERALTINTTAAGGNATLLALN